MGDLKKGEQQESLDEWFELFSGLPLQHSEKESRLIHFCERHKMNILSAMPWVASELAEHCGFTCLFNLIHLHGGQKIYLPKEVTRFCQIYNLTISAHSYQKLYKKIDSSGYLDTPSTWGVFIAIRRAAMQVAMKEEIPQKLLTQTFGITMRSIRLIKSRNTCWN